LNAPASCRGVVLSRLSPMPTPPPANEPAPAPLKIGSHTLASRLIVGTGKYANHEQMQQALDASGCSAVTVAVRRERLARLGREILDQLDNPGKSWVKLEVLNDKKTLLPDPVGTLEATKTLVADGFEVLCYTSDDPVMAMKLKEAGAASVMPAGSPIGSGQGVLNPNAIAIILESLSWGPTACF